MVRQSDLVVWLEDIEREDIYLVGEKSAHLGEIIQSKFPVPRGFVLTIPAYTFFLKENKLQKPIAHLLNSINYNDPSSVRQVSGYIKKLIMSAPFPQNLSNQIFRWYDRIDTKTNPLVAVRTSVLTHHAGILSSAVPYDAQLNVQGDAAVANAIREIWATMFDAKILQYCHTHKQSPTDLTTAVIVQKMIDAQSSGIVFTVHPTTGEKNTIIIEAIAGLGEYLKNKGVKPDQYTISKNDLSITDKRVAHQEEMLIRSAGKSKQIKLAKKSKSLQKVSDKDIVSLAEYAKKIEQYYFFPQDIEWAIENGQIYIIETKPLTAGYDFKPKETVKPSFSHTVRPLLIGEGASPGIGVGFVKIVTKQSDIEKFRTGDVLVAKSTSPIFEPAMRRASAIIVENPLKNSHTAFSGRKFGVPTVIGVPNAYTSLKSGALVTVKGNSGEILKGNLKLVSSYKPHQEEIQIKTKVYISVTNLKTVQKSLSLPIDGVGSLSMDTILQTYGVHPKKIIHDKKTHEFLTFAMKEIASVAKAVYPKQVLFSLSDFDTRAYRSLQGGREYEPFSEKNNLLGYRGSFRYLSDPRVLQQELSLLTTLRASGYNNIQITIPYVRSVKEFTQMRSCIYKAGFKRSSTCKVWMTCATPANIYQLEEYVKEGLDGIILDADTLSQLITGYDRHNTELLYTIHDFNPIILSHYEMAINICKKHSIPAVFDATGISLTPDLTQKLVQWGIRAVNVIPESVYQVKEYLYQAEKK